MVLFNGPKSVLDSATDSLLILALVTLVGGLGMVILDFSFTVKLCGARFLDYKHVSDKKISFRSGELICQCIIGSKSRGRIQHKIHRFSVH